MFFGLCNSPATFQAYVNQTFQKEIAEGWMIVYMDDILIFSKSLEEHQERTCRVLETICKETLFLKPKKCTFDTCHIPYFGPVFPSLLSPSVHCVYHTSVGSAYPIQCTDPIWSDV
jgi:hypothetical protein